MKRIYGILAAVTFLSLPMRSPAQTSTVPWSTFSSGFAVSTSSTSMVRSCVGEALVGATQGPTSMVIGGFLADTLFRANSILQATVAMNAGWNLMSIPLRVLDSTVTLLFPGALSQAFAYSSGYVVSPTLSPSKGYWLKVAASQGYAVSGTLVATRDIPVVAGWNIIGPLEAAVATSAITTVPASIIQSNFFGYQSAYVAASTLSPGKGYWVKVSQTGVLQLGGGGAAKEVAAEIGPSETWTRVVMECADDSRGVVYLAKSEEMTGNYELPPIPPSGVFDVRFSGNTIVERSDQQQYEIDLSSASYPLTITAQNLNGKVMRLRDAVNGTLLNEVLQEGKTVLVAQKLDKLILVQNEQPKEFALEQNYPNPFNPTTVVSWQLPVFSNAKLVVFDMLGREVSVLVNEKREPGRYSVEFDASRLASGVYIYRLTAGTYVASRKMLLTK